MTQTVGQAVAKRDNGPVAIIQANKAKIAPVLPDHIDVDQFIGVLTGALYRDPKLMEAATNNPGALMNEAMRCARLGHAPGSEEFYLIPRKIKGQLQVQGIEGYRGIVERMYRSGAVASVIVREVCANDKFRYIEGVTDRPQHNFSGADVNDLDATGADFFGATGSRSRGEMVGVYAYAILTTAAVSRVVILSKDDVMAAKAASDGADSQYSPWNRLDGGKDHPEFTGRSMWWKTAARRLEPWVPTSSEYRREQMRAVAEADRIRHADRHPVEVTGRTVDTGSGEIVDGELVEQEWPEAAQPADAAESGA